MRTALRICCCFLMAAASLAQTPAPGNCSPVGTWYGGSDVKYLFTITPITGDRFTTRAEVVADIASVGPRVWTSWSGQLLQIGPNRYLGQYISMYTTSTEVPPPPDSMELDGVRGYLSFRDCDNIRIEYDYYLVYFDLNRIAFVDAADITIDITGTVETYHRMPMNCPACSPAIPALQGSKKH
jgi:hypothetical protein